VEGGLAVNLTRYPSDAEWREARRFLIGGSDVAPILGLSPWLTPLGLWNRKVGLEPDDFTPSIAARLGKLMEPVIAKMLAEEAGVLVMREENAIVRHAEFPVLACSPDGWAYTKADPDPVGPYLFEAKTADVSKVDDWRDGVPPYYLPQVLHSLDVCGLERAYVAVLFGTRDFKWTTVDADPQAVAEMRPKLLDFARRVAEEDPPLPGADDAHAIAARFPRDEVESVLLPPEALELHWQIQGIENAHAELGRDIEERRNKLKVLIGNAGLGILPGGEGTYRFKADKRGVRALRFQGRKT